MTPEWWTTQSVVVVILGLVGIGLWRMAIWVRDEILKPAAAAHLELIKSLKEHIPKQTEAIDSQTKEIRSQTTAITAQNIKLDHRTELFSRIIANQGRIIAGITAVKENCDNNTKSIKSKDQPGN